MPVIGITAAMAILSNTSLAICPVSIANVRIAAIGASN